MIAELLSLFNNPYLILLAAFVIFGGGFIWIIWRS